MPDPTSNTQEATIVEYPVSTVETMMEQKEETTQNHSIDRIEANLDNLLKSLKEIGLSLTERLNTEGNINGRISPIFAAYLTRCCALAPEFSTAVWNASDLLKILERTETLLINNDPSISTIRMQVDFECLFSTISARNEKAEADKEKDLKRKLESIASLCDTLTNVTAVGSLYRSIFSCLLQHGGIDNDIPQTVDARKEIAAALESVLPQSALPALASLTHDQRVFQCRNFIPLVLGIRLFNRSINKGGEGLTNLEESVSAQCIELSKNVENEIAVIGELASNIADIVTLEIHHPGTISTPVDRLRSELVHRRQYALFLQQLHYECAKSLEHVRDLCDTLSTECSALKQLVGVKSSVPKETVYPHFALTGATWNELRKENQQHQLRQQLFEVLSEHKADFVSHLNPEELVLALQYQEKQTVSIPNTEAQFASFVKCLTDSDLSSEDAIETESDNIPVRLTAESAPQTFMTLPLEYQGFCPWSLVHHNGLLTPGDPSLGVIRWRRRHYSFVNVEAMKAFLKDPSHYLKAAVQIAKLNPALIHLLCLQPIFPNTDIGDLLVATSLLEDAVKTKKSQSCASVGCQTRTHIDTESSDPDYHWNEWELRRRALQYTKITHMKTHGTQTHLSHFRRDNYSQYTLPGLLSDGTMEGVGTMTRIDKGTNSEKTTRHIGGLRGTTHGNLKVSKYVQPDIVTEGTNGDLRLSLNLAGRAISYSR